MLLTAGSHIREWTLTEKSDLEFEKLKLESIIESRGHTAFGTETEPGSQSNEHKRAKAHVWRIGYVQDGDFIVMIDTKNIFASFDVKYGTKRNWFPLAPEYELPGRLNVLM
jgi:hypothetical protein